MLVGSLEAVVGLVAVAFVTLLLVIVISINHISGQIGAEWTYDIEVTVLWELSFTEYVAMAEVVANAKLYKLQV